MEELLPFKDLQTMHLPHVDIKVLLVFAPVTTDFTVDHDFLGVEPVEVTLQEPLSIKTFGAILTLICWF